MPCAHPTTTSTHSSVLKASAYQGDRDSKACQISVALAGDGLSPRQAPFLLCRCRHQRRQQHQQLAVVLTHAREAILHAAGALCQAASAGQPAAFACLSTGLSQLASSTKQSIEQRTGHSRTHKRTANSRREALAHHPKEQREGSTSRRNRGGGLASLLASISAGRSPGEWKWPKFMQWKPPR